MENYIENGNLINENKWRSYIDSLRKGNNICISNKDEALSIINDCLVNSVRKRIDSLDRFGVMFSGGLDSVLIAKICKDLGRQFTCYTIGFKNSKDVVYYEKAAKLLNLKLKIKILNKKDLDEALRIVVILLNNTNPVYISIACVTYLGLKFAKESNEKVILNGLGAEEIFCGYQRHLKENNEEINKESWRGLKEMWKVDLERDYLIAKSLDVDIRTPFIDKDLIMNAMKIDPSLKISKDIKKIILRYFAESINVSREIAHRPKVAGQYGTKINKEMKKLSKQNNFKYVKEYLKSLNK